MTDPSVQNTQSGEGSTEQALLFGRAATRSESGFGTEADSEKDRDLWQLQAEAPTPARLIDAMDRYLAHDSDLQAFALDYEPDTHAQFTAGMQRITMQALLLQCTPSYDVFRDRLIKHIREQDAQAIGPRRSSGLNNKEIDLVKIPTAASLLRYIVSIFGGPRQQQATARPPLTAADLDAFIVSIDAGHILTPGMDTTSRLTRLLTVKTPEDILSALRQWARIDLSPYEKQLASDSRKPEGFWKRLRTIATEVPEKSSLMKLLIEVFRDPFELDLFCMVSFPRAYHRAVRSNKDRAEALTNWIWTGLIWDKLETYLSKEFLSDYKKDLVLRSDLQRLTVWGALMALIAILSTELEGIRERLTELQEKYKGTFIGVIAATLLGGIALIYCCNPLAAKPIAPMVTSQTEPLAVPSPAGSGTQTASVRPAAPPKPEPITQSVPGCSEDGFCREAALLAPHHLRRIFGTPDGHIFAAGDQGTLLHFDGSIWSNASPPVDGKLHTLVGIFGTSATDLWVAGHGSTLLHFGQAGWESQVLAAPAELQSLWGTGDTLWAVGQRGAFLARTLGTWSAVEIAGDSKGKNRATLSTLFGTGPRDVWAVGSGGTILHFDGERWAPSPSGTQRPLYAVWGSASDNVWAVGEYGTILHFDGSAWKVTDPGAPWFANALHGVWGGSGNEVWAVGTKGLVLRHDGKRWQPVSSGVQSPLRDVWVSARGDVWIVGNDGLILRRSVAG